MIGAGENRRCSAFLAGVSIGQSLRTWCRSAVARAALWRWTSADTANRRQPTEILVRRLSSMTRRQSSKAAGPIGSFPSRSHIRAGLPLRLRRRLGERIQAIVLVDWLVLDPPPPFIGALAGCRDLAAKAQPGSSRPLKCAAAEPESLVRQAKLGAFRRVRIPAREGLTTHLYRVLQ